MPGSSENKYLNGAQAVEMMVEYARRNLLLEDRKETSSKHSMILSGKGVCGVHKGKDFELEMIVDLSLTWDSKKSPFLKERLGQLRKKEQPYRMILFPKSIDYANAGMTFEGPFFKSPGLLESLRMMIQSQLDARQRVGMENILDNYKRFEWGDVKKLSRLEWKYALSLNESACTYFNPLHQCIDRHSFARFEPHQIIPGNRKEEQNYFWKFVLSRKYPEIDYMRMESTFRGIQKGLHDSVRRIVETEHVKGGFTLLANGNKGALPAEHEERMPAHYGHAYGRHEHTPVRDVHVHEASKPVQQEFKFYKKTI